MWSNGRMIDLGAHVPEQWLSISFASAINDAGQIAAEAWDGNDSYAVILTPRPRKPGDTDCDDLVNINDLLNVIGAWGDAGPGLYEDLNGDKVIDFQDIIAVLLNWNRG
jgi:hypothetical protein